MASLEGAINLAPTDAITPEQIYEAIANVLDPELDESLVKLGFIDRVEVKGPNVAITFKLPTYWCSPNFAYLMAADLRQQAATVPGVQNVRVALLDHCSEDEVSNAVNAGRSFADAFPEETTEDAHLENLRRTFLRKGFLMRQDSLLRQMLKIRLDEAAIASLHVSDLRYDEASNTAWVRIDGREHRLERVGRSALAYQQRRKALGLPHAAGDALIIDDQGHPLQAGELREFLRRSRSIRMNILFNTALCKGLFHTRYGGDNTSPVHSEDEE